MKRAASALLLVVVAGVLLGGCGSSDDGVKPEMKQSVSDISTISIAAKGDYSKLSDADKKKVLQMTGNNEDAAKQLVNQMAHPPSELNAGKGGGGKAPPPAGG